jgi:hypothetical protein
MRVARGDVLPPTVKRFRRIGDVVGQVAKLAAYIVLLVEIRAA